MTRQLLAICFLIAVAPAFAQTTAYEGGSRFINGFARVQDGNRYFYIDSNGNYAFDKIWNSTLEYTLPVSDGNDADSSNQLPETFFFVSKKGKLGILSLKGKWLLPPVYDSIDTRYGTEWIVTKNSKKSLFTATGLLLPFRFENAYNMDGNYFNVMQNGHWGVYCKSKDSVVVPCIYEDMDYCYGCDVKGDYCFAQKNGRWGVVDFNNDLLLPFEFDHEHHNMRSDEWVQCLYKNGKQLIINLKTKQADTCNCNDATTDDREEEMAQGFYIKEKNGKYGLLNAQDQLVLDYQYDYIRYDADTIGSNLPPPYIAINKGGHFGIADTSGNIIISPVYTDWFSYIKSGSMFYSDIKGRNYFLDSTGRSLIPSQYDSLERSYISSYYPEAPTLVIIRENGLTGFYNPLTKTLVKPQFTDINFFEAQQANAIIKAYKGDKEGLIDLNGNVIVPAVYDYVSRLISDPGLVRVSQGDSQGVYSISRQKLIIPAIYRYISEMKHGLFLTENNNDSMGYKCDGLMDMSGRFLLAPRPYQAIESLDSNDNRLLVAREDTSVSKIFFTLFNTDDGSQRPLPYDSIYMGGNNDLLGVLADKNAYALYDALAGKLVEGEYAQGGFPQLVYPYGNKAIITRNGKWDIVKKDGSTLFHLQYDFVQPFSSGIIMVARKNKTLTNTNNIIITSPADTDIAVTAPGENELHNCLYGFADSTGRIIVPVAYNADEWKDVNDYIDSDTTLLLLKEDKNDYGKYLKGFADKAGTIVVPPAYKEIAKAEKNKGYLVRNNKKYGIVNANGATILPAIFDDIVLDDQSYWGGTVSFGFPVLTEKDGAYQYYDINGKALSVTVKKYIAYMPAYDELNEATDKTDESGYDKGTLKENSIQVVVPPEAGH